MASVRLVNFAVFDYDIHVFFYKKNTFFPEAQFS